MPETGVVLVGPGWTDDGDAYTLEGVSRPVPTVAPAITTLAPATIAHTAPKTLVTITGTDFMRGDRVIFGGATPPTHFHSDTELAVELDPSKWQPGDLAVLIAWSSRGPSNVATFTVT